MRVHPTLLGPRRTRMWGAAALLGVNVVILTLGFARTGFELPTTEAVGPREPSVKVLVLDENVRAGDSLEKAQVSLKARPITMLPTGRIVSRDALKNRVAAGPLPAGTILSSQVLAEALPQIPVVAAPDRQPVDELLEQLATQTVAVEVKLTGTPPTKGMRIALTDPMSAGAVAVPEAWVVDTRSAGALLRMDPKKAKELGPRLDAPFTFIELPSMGSSPYL